MTLSAETTLSGSEGPCNRAQALLPHDGSALLHGDGWYLLPGGPKSAARALLFQGAYLYEFEELPLPLPCENDVQLRVGECKPARSAI
jgi:hypothetical protein